MSGTEATRPLLRVPPSLLGPRWIGGMTTRVGFPDSHWGADEDAARSELRARLAGAVSIAPDQLAWARQVHGSTVRRVDGPGFQGEADALVCSRADRMLLVAVADCGPVLLWDHGSGVFAVAHAGWRGVVAGVLEATLEAMVTLGAQTERLQVWIGPTIGPARFEVGPEVAGLFEADSVLPPAPPDRSRPHVDLPGAIRRRLLHEGVSPPAVRGGEECTFDRPDLYWSYRRDGGICGRHLGFLTRRGA